MLGKESYRIKFGWRSQTMLDNGQLLIAFKLRVMVRARARVRV